MYEINDKVVHSREGLSTIVNKTTMAGNEYFIIHADRGGGENIYVLVNNTTNLIRPIMNEEQAKDTLGSMSSISTLYSERSLLATISRC